MLYLVFFMLSRMLYMMLFDAVDEISFVMQQNRYNFRYSSQAELIKRAPYPRVFSLSITCLLGRV